MKFSYDILSRKVTVQLQNNTGVFGDSGYMLGVVRLREKTTLDTAFNWRHCASPIRRRCLRPHLCGLGYPRQPSPRITLAESTFSLFLSKIQPTVYTRNVHSPREARQLGWASSASARARKTTRRKQQQTDT